MANSNRGFAAMVSKDPNRQKSIASAGGRRAHQLGTAHEFTQAEAKLAGRKGGQVSGRLRSEQYFHQIKDKSKNDITLSEQDNLQDIKEGL